MAVVLKGQHHKISYSVFKGTVSQDSLQDISTFTFLSSAFHYRFNISPWYTSTFPLGT